MSLVSSWFGKVRIDITVDRKLWEQPSIMPWTHRSVRESRDIARYVDTWMIGCQQAIVTDFRPFIQLFIEGTYLDSHPEDCEGVQQLKATIIQYVRAIQDSLEVHKRVCRDVAFYEILKNREFLIAEL